MKEAITRTIEIPEGVTVTVGDSIVVKGTNGENSRVLTHPKISITVEENKVKIHTKQGTKREKKMIGTFNALIKNMIKGAQEPFVYTLKICSGHFPMNVSVNNKKLVIKNFLGESVPRELRLLDNVDVSINGEQIEVKSSSKELAGQTAGDIEQLCRIKQKDSRIFQDGCYITSKA
ncbi:MAG: 50S ribosomal protein L6 [Nanoarchaeota archaeon]|nr:50S ribosomal protein L6 [Nanoarchaeota archaeon]|tara:strand:+ start:7788 stop:8315 length:528 start_codon:yes stop_codon:yes gene_type:complete